MIVVIDVDASKVIEAVRSTGVVITRPMIEYTHYLISNMKNIGTWQLSNAVYGMVGGTADSHKWNWKDLRDVDAAFRLTYSGGITHSANGMQGNGTTGFADTKLNHAANLTDGNQGLSVYLRTNYKSANAADVAVDIGAGLSDSLDFFYIAPRYIDENGSYDNRKAGLITTNTGGNSIGFFNGNTSGGFISLFKNGVKIGTVPKTGVTPGMNRSVFLLARNDNPAAYFSPRQQSYAAIHQGLTDQQAIQQSQIVTNAQSILNRA